MVAIPYDIKIQTYKLVEVFPIVLGHESEGTEQSPWKRVKTGVAKVRIISRFHTGEVIRT